MSGAEVPLLPYYHIPTFNVGPVPVDPWATLVCIGFIVGMEVTRARGLKLGLEVRDIVDGLVVTVGMGFLVGHLVHVLAYHPDDLAKDGWIVLFKVWGGFSSFGGFLGALIGAPLFYTLIRKRPFWVHADTLMFGFPFGWVFGRAGCASVHDHVGRPTDFFLAVNFPGWGPRHELGLDEALYTLLILAVFWVVSRKVGPGEGRAPYKPGIFLALWCLMYGPFRFFLDFLRNTDLENADVRYAGFTPAQYGCLLLTGAGVWIALRLRSQPAYVLPTPPPEPASTP